MLRVNLASMPPAIWQNRQKVHKNTFRLNSLPVRAPPVRGPASDRYRRRLRFLLRKRGAALVPRDSAVVRWAWHRCWRSPVAALPSRTNPSEVFGVKTGTLVREARVMRPGIAIVQARPSEYIRYHHLVVAAEDDRIHVEAVLSIDEMWTWPPLVSE